MTNPPKGLSSLKSLPKAAFADVLAKHPPNQTYVVEDAVNQEQHVFLTAPVITLECESPECGGRMQFDTVADGGVLGPMIFRDRPNSVWVKATCRHCKKATKVFALIVVHVAQHTCHVTKMGEDPPYGPKTPPSVLRLFQDDHELFLKGRRCEIQGLGIGASAYYRRIIEGHRNKIFDRIIEAAQRLEGTTELIAELERAKVTKSFEASLQEIKHGLPGDLMINGQNPISLLHDLYSDSVHNLSDSEYLALAEDARTVLIALCERIAQVLQKENVVSQSLARIAKRKSGRTQPSKEKSPPSG